MLANYVLYSGLVLLGICFVLFIIVSVIELNQPDTHSAVPDYKFDINEHQNYWEAENR